MDEKPEMRLYYQETKNDKGLEVMLILYVDRDKQDITSNERYVRENLLSRFEKVNFPIKGAKVYDRVLQRGIHYHFYEGNVNENVLGSALTALRTSNVRLIEGNLDGVVRKQPFEVDGKWYTGRRTELPIHTPWPKPQHLLDGDKDIIMD